MSRGWYDAKRHTLARLDLELNPCIGMPCSGDAFRDDSAQQIAAHRLPGTHSELPFEEIRPGVYRFADRFPSRDGPGDEIEFSVVYTHVGAEQFLDCGGYARGPKAELWRELLDLCLAVDVTWTAE